MRRRYIESPSWPSRPNGTAWNDTSFLRFETENAYHGHGQLEQDTVRKRQFLPQSGGRAAQILHNVVANTASITGNEDNDR